MGGYDRDLKLGGGGLVLQRSRGIFVYLWIFFCSVLSIILWKIWTLDHSNPNSFVNDTKFFTAVFLIEYTGSCKEEKAMLINFSLKKFTP